MATFFVFGNYPVIAFRVDEVTEVLGAVKVALID
jgi:hypothetical protein